MRIYIIWIDEVKASQSFHAEMYTHSEALVGYQGFF